MNVTVLDTTLRDGAQAEGIGFSLYDKLAIVSLLDDLGVDYIEAGNPASNPKDDELFRLLKQQTLNHAKITAFGSTCRPESDAAQSPALAALLSADTPCVSIFGKAWDFHVHEVLHTTPEENLRMVRDSVAYLKANGKEVFFDAEHFFDGYAHNPHYALAVLHAAHDAGADLLILCDTNGGTLPEAIADAVRVCKDIFGDKIGIHCHNDSGLAVANTLCAVKSGACQVQGTINGYGERCGNSNLCTVLPAMMLKMGVDMPNISLKRLTAAAAAVADLANLSPDEHQPYVGRATFAHKGGMHVDGVRKAPQSFEHIDPALVGNERRFLLSEMSGKAVVIEKLRKIAPEIADDSEQVGRLLEQMKRLEFRGYQFDVAESSFELLVLRRLNKLPTFFKVLDFKVISGNPQNELSASAMIKVQVDGQVEMTAAEGNGPVDALDKALRKALGVFYPCIRDLSLSDFKVRVIDTGKGTASCVRVSIVSTDGQTSWGTVGVSENVLEASWQALTDALECVLLKNYRAKTPDFKF